MEESKKARSSYEKRVKYYTNTLNRISKNMNRVSILRLLVIAMVIVTYFLNRSGKSYVLYGVLLAGVLIFIYLVVHHRKLKNLYQYISKLREVNESSVLRLEGKWIDFKDKGLEFRNENHGFSFDLDIFGQGSLFQWINRGKTSMGRKRLANLLTTTGQSSNTIIPRQDAIQELTKKSWWRHRLQAEANMIVREDVEKEELISWAVRRNTFFTKPAIVLIIRGLPIITISLLLLSYSIEDIPSYASLFLLIPQTGAIFFTYGRLSKEFDIVHRYHRSIEVYRRILKHFQKPKFSSEYLNKLKDKLANSDSINAVEQLRELEAILNRVANRKNLMFSPINVITLWDYQCMIDLENWKRKSGTQVEQWLEVVGEIEALSSLAAIGYDYPDWTVPIITHEPSTVDVKAIGHPLLIKNRVYNDVRIQDPSRILLITGSNMSGKSTLLRTIGINLVLAYSGAKVCAAYMKCSILELHTCMRVSDNLEKGISSFYGELLRIKEIVEESKEGKQVFFLLDEIFKGTNSYDRHIGAKTLIKQLYNNGAMGLVSTHDLELEVLEKESKGNIKNYHFQEDYENNKIHFDYKLRPGPSTTRNALYLIKMIGIDVEDEDMIVD